MRREREIERITPRNVRRPLTLPRHSLAGMTSDEPQQQPQLTERDLSQRLAVIEHKLESSPQPSDGSPTASAERLSPLLHAERDRGRAVVGRQRAQKGHSSYH